MSLKFKFFTVLSIAAATAAFSVAVSAQETPVPAEKKVEKIRKGELISSDFDKVLSVSHELEHLNFFIDDTPALSIAALRTDRKSVV